MKTSAWHSATVMWQCFLTTEIAVQRALRSLVVIDNVYYQITREYPTEPVAITWISSIAAASQKLSKLDNSIAAQVLSSNKFVISESSNLQLSHDVLSVVLPSVNSGNFSYFYLCTCHRPYLSRHRSESSRTFSYAFSNCRRYI